MCVHKFSTRKLWICLLVFPWWCYIKCAYMFWVNWNTPLVTLNWWIFLFYWFREYYVHMTPKTKWRCFLVKIDQMATSQCRHDMDTLFTLLSLCEWIHRSPVVCHVRGPWMRSFHVSFAASIDKLLNKQWSSLWFDLPSSSCDITDILIEQIV